MARRASRKQDGLRKTPSLRRSVPELQVGLEVNGRYRIVKKLGGGNAGTVYLVKQLGLDMDRALKILSPKWQSLEDDAFQEFKSTFQQEIRFFTSITHRNIVKLIDASVFVSSGDDVEHLFFVMELVTPPTHVKKEPFKTIFRNASSRSELLALILQILDGLEYLHSYTVLHADIKPDNILCHEVRPGELELKLGDLGVSKALWIDANEPRLPGFTDASFSHSTRLYGSFAYTPPYARELIHSERSVDRRQLRQYLPHLDIFCLGVTLTEVASTIPLHKQDRNLPAMLGAIRPEIASHFDDPANLDVFVRIISRMTVENPEDTRCYKSIAALRRDFLKLRDEYLQPLGLPEFAIGGLRRSLTTTAGKLLLSDRVRQLVNHPMMQRMHAYRQLNLLYQVFPDANHSRFTHCLTVFRMSLNYVRALLSDAYFKYLMNTEDYTLLCAAALLHDIGHYPLAHAFDDLAARRRPQEAKTPGRYPRLQREMVKDFLNLSPFPGYESLRKMLLGKLWQIDCEALERVISRGTPSSETESVIQSILDGPIDADKAAYLTQDSDSSGVPYGLGIDLDGLFAGLIAIPPAEDRQAQIGVSLKGVIPAESIIRARSDMYSRVYWHHTNRAIMAMIQHTADYVFTNSAKFTFSAYLQQCLFMSDLEAVRVLATEYRELREQRDRATEPIVPAEGLLGGRREIYRRLLSLSASDPHEQDRASYRKLVACPDDALEEIRQDAVAIVEKHLKTELCKLTTVLLDIPRIDPTEDTLRPVFVYVPDHSSPYHELASLSDVVKALQKDVEARMKKCRLFIPPGVREQLETGGQLQPVQVELRKRLASKLR